ncbi:MAG: inorganic phosphate transporter [Bacteriovorax sp.]|nr:inorganic phosphate transporter [Bacteriovorax sp.]
MIILLTIAAVLFLAFSNGANDNFKGVATLLGSKTTGYKTALMWATVTTLSGSIVAFFLAEKLMANFSGKGLIPDNIISLTAFPISIALAASITVFLATRFGFPISTTHALTGSLVGIGLVASENGINFSKLYTSFFAPLMISPLISIVLAVGLYPLFKFARVKLNVRRESCLCIGNQIIAIAPANFPIGANAATLSVSSACCPEVSIGTDVTCEERYNGQVLGIKAKNILDSLHFLSSGAVSFARGLNDTPKIAAILMIGKIVSPLLSIALIAVFMLIGGLLYSKKVAEKMSFDITEMNDGQGFTANLVTSLIVIFASKLGMPVSTTHVSCGALFGIGSITGNAHWKSIFKIVLSWIITLPVAIILGFSIFKILNGVI